MSTEPSPSGSTSSSSTAGAGADVAPRGDVTVERLSRLQRTVATRMVESKTEAPDFALTIEIEMDASLALRERLKASVDADEVPSVNDMIVRASALALREFPRANGSYHEGSFELHSRVNVGVAVTAKDALLVPTIFDVDKKSLKQIARESRLLAERVRSRTIGPADLTDGTFTVSNLGMFGVSHFSAVINPPQAAILAVGMVAPTPVVRADEVVIRHVMRVTLSCDHRILYGADAARFLARIRDLLENPHTLVS